MTAEVTVISIIEFLGRLRTVMQENGVTIICFNAENMAGIPHAKAALAHAIRSFRGRSPIAKTLEMEALLYAAGTRQCAEAAALGIHEGENRAYVCCCPPREGIERVLAPLVRFTDDARDGFDPDKTDRLRRFFSISDEEIEAAGGIGRLQDLVIERVALLDAFR
jgi:KEOPS complex subunit Cgi121